ncbi:hypothetical protein PBI_GAIA_86 [Mycobacterium phage Gaia]|uniref:Uncharacterized protein n=1 Tax=Mycobacterium phage Gaia TaxID=1486472 RepID=A0A068F8R6_9CAUD|nr:hypothetical protein VC46_gp147 [Mycobacterium phage Gaia]AID58905.1 hypothetical protein PBI_GAIA_86 [Mycobacterium phage Gaia]AYR00023.1 RNA polymerase II subunit [Mycobacterium phage Nebkiss]
MVEQFTAIADCPKCGRVAVHWLDSPRHPTEQDWADYERAMREYDPFEECLVRNWAGDVVKRMPAIPPPKRPVDEDGSVTRVCVDCGHRWGVE